MKKMFSILMLTISFSASAQTPVPPPTPVMKPALRSPMFPQEDIQLHEQSLSILKKGFPQKGSGSWMGKPTRTLLVSAPAQYRHLAAMIVAAFSGAKSDSENAFKWLESYQCENYLACSDFANFFDTQMKAYGKSLSGLMKIKADQLGAKIQERLKTFPKPPQKGFCSETPEAQENWLRLSYQLYCAPYAVAQSPRGCGMLTSKPQSCSSTEGLYRSLARWSGQETNSSSGLVNFEHSLTRGCEAEWNVKVECDGKKLNFTCTNPAQKHPAPVVCKTISH